MEDELESFEITDWDLENEFNPSRIKRLSKKQQLYGIWADEDSDDDERPRFGSESKNKRDFTAPINFISGGFKQPAKEVKKTNDEDNSSDDQKEEEEVVQRYQKRKHSYQKSGFSGGKYTRFAGTAELQETGLGTWEKHTKGIGQRLLLKMGYEPGKGLGKDQQGIVTPIQAKKREGKGALGLYGPEHISAPMPTSSAISGQAGGKSSGQEAKESKRAGHHQWKKKGPGDRDKRVKYIYKTAEEVKNEGGQQHIGRAPVGLSTVKVIDMTGPEQRVLSGYHQIHLQHSKPQESEVNEKIAASKGQHFDLPELRHNLDLLVEMTEGEILRNDRELRQSRDRVVTLQHEDERLVQLIEHEKQQIDQLQQLLDLIQQLEDKSKDSCLVLSEAASVFLKLQGDFYEAYKIYELSDLAITIVFPLVKSYLETWDPLKDPGYALDIFKEWKDILETEEAVRFGAEPDLLNNSPMDPYHQLVWEVWMAPFRKAILNWPVRQSELVIEILERWLPFLPQWVMDNIMAQLVLPKLQAEVDSWNPVVDTMPIHAWLHPWLPLMGDRLEPLYAPIRHKLASALTNWHPSDFSAKLILEPWRGVFPKATMEAFVLSHIFPKLSMAFQGFVINPRQQQLDEWHWLMSWEDFLPQSSIVSLLETGFFPRWIQVLCAWLSHGPNYEEVSKWYLGWKALFSDSLLAHSIVRDQLKKALDVMNQAVSGPGYGAAPPPPPPPPPPQMQHRHPYGVDMDKPRGHYEAISQAVQGAPSVSSLTLSFKDLLERKAEESGILFMPIPNRYQEGKQVYRFGHVTMYLDRGVIFVLGDKTWVPTSLQSLLDMAAV